MLLTKAMCRAHCLGARAAAVPQCQAEIMGMKMQTYCMSVDLCDAVQGGGAVASEGADGCVDAGLVTGSQLHSSCQQAILVQGSMQLLQDDVLGCRIKVAALLTTQIFWCLPAHRQQPAVDSMIAGLQCAALV